MRAFSRLAFIIGWVFFLFPAVSHALPSVASELTRLSTTTLVLSFTSPATSAATTAANYTLSGTSGFSGNPTAAVLDTSGMSVTLTVPSMAALIHGSTVIVTVATSVADSAGNLVATYTVDAIPTTFNFTSATNSLKGTAYESNAVLISGVNTPVTVGTTSGSNSSLKCAKLAVGETAWGAFGACSSVTLNNGDQIKLQLTSAGTYSTTVSGGIVVGGVTAAYSVTTLSVEMAAPVPIPTNVTTSALTSLSSAINSPPSSLYISSNGVVVVPASTTATITILSSAPEKTAFWIQPGGTANFSIYGASLTLQPLNSQSVLAVLRNYKVDNYTDLQTLEIAKGTATITGSLGSAPVASIQLGTSTSPKQIALLPTGNSQPVVDIKVNDDSSGRLAIRSGKIYVRVASAASTIAVTDGATTLYANEVASLNTDGAITAIRVGSLDNNGTGVGDPLTFTADSIISTDINRQAKIPRLDAPLARINETDTLLEALFDAIGLRSNLARGGQTTQGVVPLLIDNMKYYFVAFGDVIIDTTRTDGVIFTSDGNFVITRSGVVATFKPSIFDTAGFATSMAISMGANVNLGSGGDIEIAQSGDTLVMVPEMFSQPATGAANGVGYDENGYLTYTKNGESQRLLPYFFDSQQLATTFASMAESITIQDNLDGTTTAILDESILTLVPGYRVLSPLGGIPVEHRNDDWWTGSDGLIYFKYSNGSAQGFYLR
jgi:hypothetical protein